MCFTAKSPKDKKKSHFDGVDAVRQPQPPSIQNNPSDISYIDEKPPAYNNYNPYAPVSKPSDISYIYQKPPSL